MVPGEGSVGSAGDVFRSEHFNRNSNVSTGAVKASLISHYHHHGRPRCRVLSTLAKVQRFFFPLVPPARWALTRHVRPRAGGWSLAGDTRVQNVGKS